jgi:putative transposase
MYLWADGIHFNVRLEEDRQCILVLMGATPDGRKELIALADGYRESEQSWKEQALIGREGPRPGRRSEGRHGRRRPGLLEGPRSSRPDDARPAVLGPQDANVLDKLPKRIQPRAKDALHQIGMAETRQDASAAFDLFLATYEAKYLKACERLSKDRTELLAFYDFPTEHWKHLRTTNPIESAFATVRLRHRRPREAAVARPD